MLSRSSRWRNLRWTVFCTICLSSVRKTGLSSLVALSAISLLTGCGAGSHASPTAATKASEPQPLEAVVLRVEPTLWPATVRTQGNLIADEVTIVGAKIAGRVNMITVDLGDYLEADSVVATLDQEDFKLEVALSEAQLLQSRAALGLAPTAPIESLDPNNAPPVREAKAVWDETRARVARVRQLQLHARNTVTQEELDQAVAAEGAADARHAAAINGVREKIALINVRASELNVAKQHLTDTVIQAPFDGLVQERHVAHGSFVQLGDPLVTLVRTSVVRFRGTIPERHAHRLALGQQVRLKIEGVAEPRLAQVTRISPTVEAMSRSLAFEAKVANSDGSLRTGLFAEAEVMVDPNAQAIVIPRSAVSEFAGAEKVWKLVDGMAKEQVVQSARRSEDVIEITRGLAAGDEILAKAALGRVTKVIPKYPTAPPSGAVDNAEPAETVAGEETDTAVTLPATAVSTPAVDR
jgi:RND family efflux transporter MFP subunit